MPFFVYAVYDAVFYHIYTLASKYSSELLNSEFTPASHKTTWIWITIECLAENLNNSYLSFST